MNTILSLICSFFDLVLVYIFIQKTMGARKLVSSFLYIGIFVVEEIVLLACSSLISFSNATLDNVFFNIISIILTFVLTLLHEGSIKHKLFITFNFQVSAVFSELVTGIIFSFLPDTIGSFLLQNQLYGAFCSKIMLFLFINIIMLFYQKRALARSVNYTALILLMPILSIFLMLAVPVQYTTNAVQSAISSIVAVGILIANFVNYFLLQNLLKIQELRETENNLEKQIEYQSAKYQQLSTAYRDTRRLIHDTKKHYFYIKNCLENDNTSVILPYLDDSITDMEKTFISVNTGNLVIDSFVSNYASLSKQEGIQFRTDIQITPQSIPIKDYDLSTILGNLLDNALAACRLVESPNPRQISVEIFTSSQELVIHIENTLNEKPKNSKNDLEQMNHGYGTQNVENTTMRYYGNYTHSIKNGSYHAIVSIPCNIQ